MTKIRRIATRPAVYILLLVLVSILLSQSAPPQRVGLLPDGSFLLNSGWRLRPAGVQIPLDTLPMSSTLSRDGRFLFVLNGGYKPPTISVIEVSEDKVVSSVPVPKDAWLGLALSADGKTLWVGGGSSAAIHEFKFDGAGALSLVRTLPLVAPDKQTSEDFIGDIAVSPDGRALYAADIFHDSITVVNTQSGAVLAHFKTGRRPYRILFHPDGKSYFVTSWADGTLHHHQANDGSSLQTVRVGAHPADMLWRDGATPNEEGIAARIFVAAANTNNVYSIGVSASKDLKPMETINIATTPRHPLGMTPSALALSADAKTLYVVCSDSNAVAVADVTEARTRVNGFIPTGWYPTAAKALADGRLIVLNGKGLRSFPNAHGPQPMSTPEVPHRGGREGYVGNLQTGTASVIPPVTEEQLAAYTRQVLGDSAYTDSKLDVTRESLPADIQHVIYIIKENRTYDQVLGDLGKGEGDASLTLFHEKIGPNHHKLAREFMLLDNFYVSADVSADGHNWSTSAIANDYVVKFWPNSYGNRRKTYDYEGGEPAALPPAGYFWTNAAARGITMRSYGYWSSNKEPAPADGVQIEQVKDAVLAPVTNMQYRGFDLDYPDVKRAQVFLKELAQFESSGKMPQFMILRLGNDHTFGARVGKPTPLVSFADNDYALGMLVEGLSKSKFWRNTAMFVLEDDAQNGPDHIDSHRSPVFVLSPYTHRGGIDSTMYNTTSVLRTMELLLGMRPMTQFDAAANPMFNTFGKEAVMTPYVAEKPRINMEERNKRNAAALDDDRSEKLNFKQADLNDDDEMNDILWRTIRGTEPPAPTRSYFSR